MDICHQPWHQISPSVFQRIESTCHYHSSADGAITHHLPSNCLKKYEESRRKNAQMSIPSWKCSIDDIIAWLFFFFFRLSHANISEPSTLITRALQFVSPSCAEHQDVCMYVSREWRSTCLTPLKTLSMSPLFWSTKTGSMGLSCPCLCTKKKHAAWQLSSAPQDVWP